MYRIRFHGRGGQGVKTASRILGSAFFAEGFEVQDAPRYGAERRGAPIFAYVRAAGEPIRERGGITRPDLLVVVDESLLNLPMAGVLEGITPDTVLLVNSQTPPDLSDREIPAPRAIVTMPKLGWETGGLKVRFAAVAMAGAAARLTGVISGRALREAISEELCSFAPKTAAQNLELALGAYHRMDEQTGIVGESPEVPPDHPGPAGWAEVLLETAYRAAPIILRGQTTRLSKTGLWRTERPVIDPALCKHCWWICTTYCPDGAISVGSGGEPWIDFDYCKGCLICRTECPSHAIMAIPEKMSKTESSGAGS